VEFEQAGKELLAVVVEEDQRDLQSSLSSLVTRWKVSRDCSIPALFYILSHTEYVVAEL